jgi:regulator of protease activity HflC (stomatin/prohibitin superfamily)
MLEELVKLISWFVPVFILGVILLPQIVRVLREYERGVIFRLGKQRTRINLSHSDRRSHGENGSARCDN